MFVDIQYHKSNCQIVYQKASFLVEGAKISKKYTNTVYIINYWQ